ncbi:MAG: TatD family hydrolase [Proteobacteria bacterium]|nr:TatD family hydrolase [Pseudomonadota bacterium]
MKLMYWYDSHFHLTALPPSWLPTQDLMGGLTVSTTLVDSQENIARTQRLSGDWRCAIGFHPWYVDAPLDWFGLNRLLADYPRLAIGEIGLDGSTGMPAMDQQLRVLKQQLGLAKSGRRVVSVHAVNDSEMTYLTLRQFPGIRGVLHGFRGSLVQAQRWQALGFSIGIGPRLLMRLTERNKEMLRSLNITLIHLETDAPNYDKDKSLTPNVLPELAHLLAVSLDYSLSELSQQLSANWQALWSDYE